jgi:multimeric flavodoxin WrbA
MKILIHDLNENDFNLKFHVIGKDITVISNNNEIHNCIGCFGCWVKTPAACVIRDKYGDMGELYSKCDEVIIISNCCYGGFSPFVKNVMDRSISFVLPYFTYRNGEMHHKNRYNKRYKLKVCFYGDNIIEEEMDTAKKLVMANSINMNCIKHEVSFYNSIQEMEGEIL